MFVKPDPDLKLRFIWIAIGYGLVMLVVYLSTTATLPELDIDFTYQDKFFHILAYFTLMAWFSQIYHDRFQRNMIAFVFVFMGVILEYMQSFDASRSFEFADMVANTVGVALGFIVALSSAKNTLLRVEKIIR